MTSTSSSSGDAASSRAAEATERLLARQNEYTEKHDLYRPNRSAPCFQLGTAYFSKKVASHFYCTECVKDYSGTSGTTNTCTITMWVKANLSTAGWRGLFYDRSGSLQKGIHTNNGTLRIGNWENDNQTASTLTIPNNQWTFVALTVSPTEMKAWLRTDSAGTFSTWASSTTSFTPRQWQRPGIGGDLWNSNLAGSIDDVRFYDRTLTEAELGAIFANANL